MTPALLVLLLGVVGALANQKQARSVCASGQYTFGGECCIQCQPGEGMVKPCGATQTVCEPCSDSETFSEHFSHNETCQPCTSCDDPKGLLRMKAPCTDSNDATCVCNYGYFMSEITQRCEPCTVCPLGEGMLYSCEFDHDTMCEECNDDTYSDQESSREPCIPCTTCEGDDTLSPCTPTSDTVCEVTSTYEPLPFTFDSTSPFDLPGSVTVPPEVPVDSTTTTTTTADTKSESKEHNSLNEKLIPIYCSILAAVVVGLVAFIIFKKWNSCKQNKQGANSCTTNQNQTPSPEGEKLHSDSGISVDSQSLQEAQSQTQTVVTIDEEPCLLLPLHTREKVEKLLFRGSGGDDCNMDDSDWCNLAGLLGYEEERIAVFRQDEHPVCALLSDWAAKDSASMDALCTALRKINRDDVVQSLTLSPSVTKPTATSVV